MKECEYLKRAKPGQLPEAVCRFNGLNIKLESGIPDNFNECKLVVLRYRTRRCEVVLPVPKEYKPRAVPLMKL